MRRAGVVLLALVAVGAVVVIYRLALIRWDFGVAAGELPQTIRDYRAADLPWNAGDIETPVRSEENAAPLLRQAIRLMPGKAADEAFSKRFQSGTADPTPYAQALRLVHEAVKKPKLDFRRDWDLGPELLFTEYSPVRRLCTAFAVRAEGRAARNDDAGALRDLEDARRLAVLIGSEPVVISPLVGAASEALVLRGAQKCMAKAARDSERLVAYRAWLAVPTSLPDLNLALRGDLYRIVTMSRNFDQLGVGGGLNPQNDIDAFANEGPMPTIVPRRDGVPGNLRSQAYMARALQMWTELARTTNGLKAPPEMVGAQARVIGGKYENAKGLSHGLDAILFPVFIQFSRTNLLTRSRRAVTLALADAMILHARSGRWPTATSTSDPLGDGPLKVRFDGKRFRVWSVGRDGKDDGGLTREDGSPGHKFSDDEVAVYPPIPPKPMPKRKPPLNSDED